jgi:hypothetical protein
LDHNLTYLLLLLQTCRKAALSSFTAPKALMEDLPMGEVEDDEVGRRTLKSADLTHSLRATAFKP